MNRFIRVKSGEDYFLLNLAHIVVVIPLEVGAASISLINGDDLKLWTDPDQLMIDIKAMGENNDR